MPRPLSAAVASTLAATLAFATACSDDPLSARPRAPQAPRLNAAAADSARAPVAGLTVAPDTARVVVGRSLQLTAVARDSAGAALEKRASVWTSSAESVARVDSAGVVTGVALGSATITVASEGKSARAVVTVHDASVYALGVAPRPVVLVAGDSLALSANPKDAQGGPVADAVVRWASADSAVVAVDSASGVIQARSAGAARVTATSGAHSDTMTVTVVPAVVAVKVVPALDTLEAYDVRQMHAYYADSAGRVITHGPAIAKRTLRWSSSDTAVAKVDSVTGVLTGVDRGSVTITATSEDLKGTAKRVVVIRYRSLTAGTEHACNLASGGIAWCWGKNGRYAALGGEDITDDSYSAVPVRVPGGLRFTQLTTFSRTTCGLTSDGQAHCWGYNGWGEFGVGKTTPFFSRTPVAAGGGLTFRSLSAGGTFICGITVAHKAYCWGDGQWGQLGNGVRRSSYSPVAAMPEQAFASIKAGNDFACGLTLDGRTYCWGYSGAGNLGDGEKVSNGNTFSATPILVVGGHKFRGIGIGQYYVCGVDQSDRGHCWGSGASGALGNGSTNNVSTPAPVAGDLKFRTISTGAGTACGITTNDALYCWGTNKSGQMGSTTPNGSTRPVRVMNDFTASEVSPANVATGGAAYTCAVSVDRLTTSCWGRGNFGQLGNGKATGVDAINSTPVTVEGQKPLPAEK